MSSDVTPGADDTRSSAETGDHSDASRRLLEESFNEGNFAVIDQLVAADAVTHDPATPAEMRDLRGPELLKRTVGMYRSAFPDVRMTVDEVITAGDKVVLRWHSEGTHRGELRGLAPTGARGSVTGISIDRWQNDKLVESWIEWDNFGLARQLGAAPSEGSVGEKIGIGAQRVVARWMQRKNQN
ncbi:MAG: ester cyclase [Solirubrobacterales bacterium]|nr:ester cyclase [Solirubrobacterales bacterium]MBV9049975.1 ester cyclase [Solirubrobacterales bacterium]